MREHAHLKVGEMMQINGQWMRHLGSGLFEPATPQPLEKRFDTSDSGPLIRRDA
jgi:hypothetical protein